MRERERERESESKLGARRRCDFGTVKLQSECLECVLTTGTERERKKNTYTDTDTHTRTIYIHYKAVSVVPRLGQPSTRTSACVIPWILTNHH